MKNIIKLEEAGMFILCIYALSLFHVAWWVYLLVLLAPDIGLAGYFVNSRFGAVCYNVLHHKAIAVVVFGLGLILNYSIMEMAGIILFGHSSLDRAFGYGLKLKQGFKYTHLGIIEKK